MVLGMCALYCASASATPPSDDTSEWGDDDDDDEFDESDVPELTPTTAESSSPWSLTGNTRTRFGFWAERLGERPLAKARQSLDLRLEMARSMWLFRLEGHGEYDAAYQVDRDTYDQPTLDAYEWLIRSGEAFGRASPGNVQVTVGRQVIAWGEGDALSPLDIINPRDNREPGLADLDDLRLPVLATRLALFLGSHRLELVGVHESDFGLQPSPRGPFSPFDAVLSSLEKTDLGPLLSQTTFRLTHQQERFSLDQQEVFFRWVYRGKGIDVGFQAASLLDRQGVFAFPKPEDLLASDTVDLTVDHRRYTTAGHSGAWVLDAFVLKWELGVDVNRAVNTGDLAVEIPEQASTADLAGLVPAVGVDEATLVNSMVGVTWSGIQDLRIGLEVGKGWLVDGPDDLAMPLTDPLILLRASYQLMRERLQLSAAASMVGWTANGKWLFRGEAAYEILDGLKAGLGYVTYQPGDDFGLFYGLNNHDRFFTWLRWDFRVL